MQKTNRDANIELLRMLMGMAVVVLHYNYLPAGGGAAEYATGINSVLLHVVQAICCVAVNVFILISGYFSVSKKKVNIIKPIRLLVQLIIFDVLIYFINCFAPWGNMGFSLRGLVAAFIPANYYVILYIVVMLLSPYLNQFINWADEKNRKHFIVLLGIVFLIYPSAVDVVEWIGGGTLNGLSSIGLSGSGAGYTIVNFVVCYCIGAYLRKTDLSKIKIWQPIIGWVLCVGITTIISFFNTSLAWMYCNPFVVFEGVCLFVIFAKLKIRSRFILTLAPASFCCYLIHGSILHYFNFEFVANAQIWLLAGLLLATIVGIYLLSWGVHMLWTFLTSRLWGKLEKCAENKNWFIGIKE